jgi:predicted NBD/HSP70 family sugar kinase/biotin operon repressor
MPAGRQDQLESHRRISRLRIVDTLRAGGEMSRADVARATGLSRPMVSNLVHELRSTGLVLEDAEPVSTRGRRGGRPPIVLRLNASAGAAVGIDFDHSRVSVAVSDLALQSRVQRTEPLDPTQAAEDGLDLAADMVERALVDADVDRSRVVGVGMALPGTIEQPYGVVGPSSVLPQWTGVAAAAEMGRRLGLPVVADNDANLGAVAEAAFGAARRAQDVFYVKITSGIGAGVIVKGGLYRGAAGRAGEIGHVRVRQDGPICRCGRRGCLETVASTDALRRALRHDHDRDVTVAGMIEGARAGDADCRRAITDGGRALGGVLAAVLNVLNPEMVVIGGDLAPVGDILVDAAAHVIASDALAESAACARVVPGVLGDHTQLLGALAFAISGIDRPIAAASRST